MVPGCGRHTGGGSFGGARGGGGARRAAQLLAVQDYTGPTPRARASSKVPLSPEGRRGPAWVAISSPIGTMPADRLPLNRTGNLCTW